MFEDFIKEQHRGVRGNVPQCLGNQATSQAVLGYSGQKYAGPFAFLCCEVVEETNKTACGKGEKTSSTKKFKHIESDLKAAQEQVRSNELYKKMEAEYQATIVEMQKRIEELGGTKKKQVSQMHVSIIFCQFCQPKQESPRWQVCETHRKYLCSSG